MKKYLLLFTIGPVQSFIAQARKAQDLYAGSKLLSETVKIGINSFKNHSKKINATGKIIFPTNYGNEKVSLPNRFIAKVEGDLNDEQKLKEIGNAVKENIKEGFEKIAKNTIGPFYSEQVRKQILRHLEVYWAALPIKSDSDYKTTYLRLEKLLGAVKNVRPFKQLDGGQGELGRKCSLDGENNALFYHGNPALIRHNNGRKEIKNFILNKGEAISALSFLKRKFQNVESFPSVAEVALWEAVDKLPDRASSCIKDFKELCSGKNGFTSYCLKNEDRIQLNGELELNTNFDYQLLYPENITIKNFPNDKQREYAKNISEKLIPYLKDKYYALVMFDGDKMGEWLSGKHTSHDGITLETFHENMSTCLSDFVLSLDDLLVGRGKIIYAGGDDFLGIVNLHHLFSLIEGLRLNFNKEIDKQLEGKKTEKHLTFSAGIVIAHYKTPLSEVLLKVREMEKKAKEKGERNAFALAVIKHSGEIQETIYKWDEDENNPEACSNWKDIEVVYKELRSGNFSNKFISSLTTEMYQLAGLNLGIVRLKEGLITEMKRLVTRNKEKGDINQLLEAVINLYNNSKDNHNKTQNFIHALQIADFLNRRINEIQN